MNETLLGLRADLEIDTLARVIEIDKYNKCGEEIEECVHVPRGEE